MKEEEFHYFGDFKNGIRNGFGISILNKNFISYIGQWKDGLRHGKGVLKENGLRIEGEWKDDKLIYGKSTGGAFSYEGPYLNDLAHGFGKTVFSSGFYEGEHKEGKRNGYGIYKWNDEDFYEGEWKDDKLIYGKESRKSYVYQGNFKNGVEDGLGKTVFKNGEYTGSYKRGKRDGFGVYKWKNGDVFEGEWKFGKKYFGTYYNADDNSVYQGYYLNKVEGLFSKNGKTFHLKNKKKKEIEYVPLHELKTFEKDKIIQKLRRENNTLIQIIKNKNENKEQPLCNVCMSNNINCILNCGHFCFCSNCISKVDNCPLCKEKITNHIKFYF